MTVGRSVEASIARAVKEWSASDVRISLHGDYVHFKAPCGESRFMSVVEAKALAKKINDLAQAWARS